MREEFLHYLWKYKKFDFPNAKTTDDKEVVLLNSGQHNLDSGPDFFNAKVRIGEQVWAGNIEIHIKSSDWYLHKHQTDKNYDNVILHVVWEHTAEVYRKNNTPIPTLQLKPLVSPFIIENYHQLLDNPLYNWINCEKDFSYFQEFEAQHWLERLYIERLEKKSQLIVKLLKNSENNWEEVLFIMLARNFGLKVNQDAFLSVAQSFDFKALQKVRNNPIQLEALLLGQAGLLEQSLDSGYYQVLKREYEFLKHKFNLNNEHVIIPKYFRLRPHNFPTIRLSQLAQLFYHNRNLFSEIISAKDSASIYGIFQTKTSEFWENHYTFGKRHKPRSKKLTRKFTDLLIINTIVPLKFCYLKHTGQGSEQDSEDELLKLMEEIKAESNSTVSKFEQLKQGFAKTALQSQALLQLKNEYCDKNQCLRCEFGNKLLIQTR